MSSVVTRGELAELARKLPKGELRDWCDLSSTGPESQVVFADSVMLSRCRDAASSSTQKESKQKESKKCKASKTMKDKSGTSL